MPASPDLVLPAPNTSPKLKKNQSHPPPDAVPERKLLLLTLLLLATIIYIGVAGKPSLLDDADAAHAIVARDILRTGDWVVMRMNGVRWLAKAPLHYWLVAASYAVLGDGTFSTRLPLALAVIGLVAMLYFFGKHFFGEREGFYAALIMATSLGTFIFTRIMIPEAICALEFTAIFYLFLRAWRRDFKRGVVAERRAYWACATLIALALLTRGLIGIIFPVATIVLFLICTRSSNRWRKIPWLSSGLIFLAVALPWHVLAIRRAPQFIFSYFINEHFLRALGTRYPPDYDATPLPLWLGAHLAWFFPWSIFLPLVFYGGKTLRKALTLGSGGTGESISAKDEARLLVILWAGTIFLFFSLVVGSRMEYYAFGAWPAVALLIGVGLARAEQAGQRWLSGFQALLAVIGAGLAAVLAYALYISSKVQASGDISTLLKTHDNDFYRLSMGHFFDLTPQAFALLRLPAAGAAACFFVFFSLSWLLRRRSRHLAANISIAVGMTVFFLFANLAFQVFEPHMSSRPLADKLLKHLRPQDQIVIYGDYDGGSSIAFYTRRNVLLFNGRHTNMELGANDADAPKIFFDDQNFPALWAGPSRIFLFVAPPYEHEALIRLPPQASYLMAESGGKSIYVNQPLSPGQPTLAELARAARENGGTSGLPRAGELHR